MVIATHIIFGAYGFWLPNDPRGSWSDFVVPDGSLPTVWNASSWRSFLDYEEAVVAAVQYVEENPVKEGRPKRKWPFVRPFPAV